MSSNNLKEDGIYYLNEFVKCFYQKKKRKEKNKNGASSADHYSQSLINK